MDFSGCVALAVSRQWCAEAHPTMTRTAKSIGTTAVLVQAKDEWGRRAFYLPEAEWLEFPAGSRTLWLPVGVVGSA